MKNFVLCSAICALLFASTPAQSQRLPNSQFWVGYNEAWFKDENYGIWLARNYVYGLDSKFDIGEGSFIRNAFLGMANRNSGAKIVRIWLFPALQGIKSPSLPNTPDTLGLAPDFVDNLEKVIRLAKVSGLQVYITMLNGVDMKTVAGVAPLKTYFQNLLLNRDNEMRDFKWRVMYPILSMLDAKFKGQNAVYAFDLINEIEAPLLAGYFPDGWLGARRWMADTAAFVKWRAPWLPVTASAGWGYQVAEIVLGLYSGLGLSFYDAHMYSDTGQYVGQTALCARVAADRSQIVLGEFGQETGAYSDTLQAVSAYNFLARAKASCFASALAWKFETTMEPWKSYTTCLDFSPGSACYRPAFSVVRSFGTSP